MHSDDAFYVLLGNMIPKNINLYLKEKKFNGKDVILGILTQQELPLEISIFYSAFLVNGTKIRKPWIFLYFSKLKYTYICQRCTNTSI